MYIYALVTKKGKVIVINAASTLSKKQRGELDNEYKKLSNAEKMIARNAI